MPGALSHGVGSVFIVESSPPDQPVFDEPAFNEPAFDQATPLQNEPMPFDMPMGWSDAPPGEGGGQHLLEKLNDEQRAAVTAQAKSLCIIAGAGSGKTRVLTRRIAYRSATGDLDPRKVLTLTFTRKAAGELTSRLRSLGLRDSVAAGTFHGIAYAQLRSRWSDNDVAEPELLDRKVGFVARLLPRRSELQPFDLVSEIEWAKARRMRPSEYVAGAARVGRRPPVAAEQVAELYGRYEQQKASRNMIDFDDLLILARREIEADPNYAEAQQWRRRHIFVDEFQDVNPLQFALLQAWMGPESDLCVVGDPRQAIYGWNGADSAYLDEFPDLFSGAKVVALSHNHRSTPQILTMANAVLGHRQNLIPTRPSGPMPVSRMFVNDNSEARGIARTVRDARRPGARWSEQAVLVRTNAQVTLLEEAFRKAKIPFRSRGGKALLDRPEVRTVMNDLRRGRPDLTVALLDVEAAAAALGGGDPAEATSDSEADANANIEERRASLLTLVRLGNDFLAIDPGGDVGRFSSWLQRAVGNDLAESADGVDLATFHSAKGLEWPIVHIGGLEEGLVPIGFAKTPAAQKEERHLMYVALTRAEHALYLSWAEQRTIGRRTANRTPSPFLKIIEDTMDLVESGTPLEEVGSMIAQQRAVLEERRPAKRSANGPRSAAESDPAFTALKAWRMSVAKASNVPAYVVFNDATLIALTEERPGSLDELLTVSGIGPVKASRYGDAVLAVLADVDA